jgi:hypothetical protein
MKLNEGTYAATLAGLPKETQAKLRVAVAEFVREQELECDDNYRMMAQDDVEMLEVYRDEEAQGCCGRAETVLEVDGQKFLFGCNHGH